MNMHPALEGALVGLGIAIVLYFLQWYLLKKQAKERAIRQHKPNVVEFDSTELASLRAARNMCLVVPFFFAGMYWLVS